MTVHRLVSARWILPVTEPPIEDGAVLLEDGRVRDFGPASALRRRHPEAPESRHPGALLLPGLVNAHTHLALTRLAPTRAKGFYGWLGEVAVASRALSAEAVREAVHEGAAACWDTGTVAVGEIAVSPEGAEALADHGRLQARVYFEFLGVSEARARSRYEAALAAARDLHGAPRLVPGLSPHAPYSVWPPLWREMASNATLRWATHLAEAPGEEDFLLRGTGPVREYLETLGVWDGTFPLPRRPAVAFLPLDERALLVHGVHLGPSDMAAVARSGATVCLCPRSNAALGLPPPPLRELTAAGVRLALGTDSRASNEDLSLWGEMRAIRRLAPDLPAGEILRMATLNGARALGLEDGCGFAGGRALCVDAPDLAGADPAEYLVRERVDARVRHLA